MEYIDNFLKEHGSSLKEYGGPALLGGLFGSAITAIAEAGPSTIYAFFKLESSYPEMLSNINNPFPATGIISDAVFFGVLGAVAFTGIAYVAKRFMK